ncbi:hypothetical protein K438DRAFT_71173 [Mycena galopus ATCC 62051]|nr:hypothetical protein K438DRAFT_71173 [Mycena galopus ATCC 62051]
MMPLSGDLQEKLATLILQLSPEFSEPQLSTSAFPDSRSTVILRQCIELEAKHTVLDFEILISYIRAAFYIQWRIKTSPNESLSYSKLAEEVGPKVTQHQVQRWYSHGSRLIYLAASSSMYIITMIAVCGLRHELLGTQCDPDLIQRLGYLLCEPPPSDHENTLSKDCGDLVRSHIVPQMLFIKQVSTSLLERFSLDFPPSADGPWEKIGFGNIKKMSSRLREFDYNFFKLPELDKCWEGLENSILAPALPMTPNITDITEDCVAEEVTIRTDFDLKSLPCPVTPKNSNSWTEAERRKAAEAYVVKDTEDLKEQLTTFHVEGQRSRDGYLCIPTEILDG